MHPNQNRQGTWGIVKTLFSITVICVLGLFSLAIYQFTQRVKESDQLSLKLKQEVDSSFNKGKGGEALTQNGGRLRSEQQGNVHYFYQVDATNGARIPLPDYKVMLNAFDSTTRSVGPVVSVSPEITPYNGRLAYMGMWVTFMPRPPESLSR